MKNKKMDYFKLTIYTDGGARGNPGPAGLGVVMYAGGEIVKRHSRYLGKATNNQAEYRAVIDALEHAREMGAKEIDLVMDSELVVKQLNREYRVKDKDLGQLFVQVWNLTLGFSKFTVRHVRREQNKEADKMVNEAIDRGIRAER